MFDSIAKNAVPLIIRSARCPGDLVQREANLRTRFHVPKSNHPTAENSFDSRTDPPHKTSRFPSEGPLPSRMNSVTQASDAVHFLLLRFVSQRCFEEVGRPSSNVTTVRNAFARQSCGKKRLSVDSRNKVVPPSEVAAATRALSPTPISPLCGLCGSAKFCQSLTLSFVKSLAKI